MRKGTAHNFMPEDVDDVLVAGFDFADDMPQETGPARTAWHADVLDTITAETGVYVADLLPLDGTDPDYLEAETRLNAAGFDTYNSDTTFEVYRAPVTCSEWCATDCHDDDEDGTAHPGNPSGPVDVARILEALDGLEDVEDPDVLAFYVQEIREALEPAARPGSMDNANPHGITRPHLRDLDAETLAACTCDECGRTGLDEYACPLALKNNEPTCLDCCDCPEHVADRPTATALASLRETVVATRNYCTALLDEIDRGRLTPADADEWLEDLESGDHSLRSALLGYSDTDDETPGERTAVVVGRVHVSRDMLTPEEAERVAYWYDVDVLVGVQYSYTCAALSLEDARRNAEELDPATLDDAETEVARVVLNVSRVDAPGILVTEF